EHRRVELDQVDVDLLQVLGSRSKIGRAQSELQSRQYLVCRLLLEKKNKKIDGHLFMKRYIKNILFYHYSLMCSLKHIKKKIKKMKHYILSIAKINHHALIKYSPT